MTRVYLDSSAIFKLEHHELETLALVDFLEVGSIEASTSVIGEVEVCRHLISRKLDHKHAMKGFYLIPIDDEIRRRAIDLGHTTVRALDAIHVATALAIADRDVQFITYDERQAVAARAAGLKVIQPGRAC